MAVIDPKCRMVSFRLSAAEYAEAEIACRSKGYRSLSLFARSALIESVSSEHHDGIGRAGNEELRRRVDMLAAELKRVTEIVRLTLKSSVHDDPPEEKPVLERHA